MAYVRRRMSARGQHFSAPMVLQFDMALEENDVRLGEIVYESTGPNWGSHRVAKAGLYAVSAGIVSGTVGKLSVNVGPDVVSEGPLYWVAGERYPTMRGIAEQMDPPGSYPPLVVELSRVVYVHEGWRIWAWTNLSDLLPSDAAAISIARVG